MLLARIAIIVTVIFGQLWGLTAALDAWYAGRTAIVWLVVAFEALSFLVALGLGSSVIRGRR
jgi:hypothetical protein